MRVDRLINVLSKITLIEMMVTIALGVTFSDVLRVSTNYGRVARAVLANTILCLCDSTRRESVNRNRQLSRKPLCWLGNRLCIVSDDCDRIRCVGVGQTYASRHRLNEDEGRMNKELPITYLARYEEAAWSPTGQPYWAQPSTEESEQLARRVGSGLRRDDSHQVDASGTMPSTKRKKQNSRTRSI